MRNSSAGGVFMALGSIVGVFIGRRYGQTSIGLIAGLAIGTGIALLVWLRDRSA